MHSPHWIALGGWVVGWLLLWRVPRLPRRPGALAVGPVTVVIPARNEAARLPALLDGLTQGGGDGLRVVVVDDHSTDGTAEVARRYPGVEVLPAPPLPPGWMGKAWACHSGAEAAAPGALALVDADVRLSADALRAAVAEHQDGGGLVSIWPHHEVRKPYEHLSALFNVASFMGVGAGSAIPPRQVREALGPVLVTSTEDYRRVGGHASVRADIVEDLALGRRYAEAGLPVRVYGGGPDVRFRMYGEGLRGLVRGWVKSFGRGTVVVSPLRVLGIAFWVTCSLGAMTWAGGLPKAPSFVLMGLFMVQMAVMFRQVGTFGVVDGLLYPVHAIFFTLVFVLALVQTHVLRNVSWRGRSYGGGAPPSAPP